MYKRFVVPNTSWSAALVVGIPIAVLFGPALVTDASFALRDAAHFYYPLFQWCCREWAAGRVPLWNPYENCGVPLLADATSSVFYPGKLMFLLPVDFALRFKLYVVGHVALAAAGSYRLARAWNASFYAAATAAISYSCGGSVVFQYANVVYLVGAAWLPLAALAADRALRDRSWKAAVLLGGVLSMMILGGDPQAAYHSLLIAALYALLLSVGREKPGGWNQRAPLAPAHREGSQSCRSAGGWRGLVAPYALLGLAAAIALLLAAVQILPSAEATKYSERAAFNRPRNLYEAFHVALAPKEVQQPLGETKCQSILRGLFGQPEPGQHHDLIYDFSVGPWRLAEYFWPNVGGRMYPTHRRWMSLLPAEGRIWTPTLYLGLLPLMLGLTAFRLRTGAPQQRWLSWLLLLFTLGSFGGYGVGWLANEMQAMLRGAEGSELFLGPGVGGLYWLMVTLLPGYAYFRYPAKLLPLVALGLSQLAAIGWDGAFAQPRPRLRKALVAFAAASCAAALPAWFIGPRVLASFAASDPAFGPFDHSGACGDVLAALLHAAAVAFAGLWLLRRAWRDASRPGRWQLLAVLLTAGELALANCWLVVTAPANLWRDEAAAAKAIYSAPTATGADESLLREPPRYYRGNLASWRPPAFAATRRADRLAEIARWERDTLFPKYHLPSRLSLVESYGSIKLMDYESLLFVAKQHGLPQPDNALLPQPTALRLLGTEFLLLPQAQQPAFAEQLEPGANGLPQGAALWRMKRTFPRAWIVRQVVSLPPLPRPVRIEQVDQRTREVLFPGLQARNFLQTAVIEISQPPREREAPAEPFGTSARSRSLESAAEARSQESCQITHYDPQRVVVRADLSRPGLVVLSDAWFPGWKATVQSEGASCEAPIHRTNRVCRGVWLPAGRHAIEFCYRPASFLLGAVTSAAAWAALALFAALNLRRHALSKDHSAGGSL